MLVGFEKNDGCTRSAGLAPKEAEGGDRDPLGSTQLMHWWN